MLRRHKNTGRMDCWYIYINRQINRSISPLNPMDDENWEAGHTLRRSVVR
jgi:hypothetical protein